MAQDFIFAREVILDSETRKSVAIIRNGEVFLDDEEGVRIAVIVGEHLYDVDGNLLGRLAVGTKSSPLSFKNLPTGNRLAPSGQLGRPSGDARSQCAGPAQGATRAGESYSDVIVRVAAEGEVG